MLSSYIIYISYPVINILTRTGKRESCFKILQESVNKQNYFKIRHIVSNDNPKNTYLTNIKDVYNVYSEKKTDINNCPYNHYLNILRTKVKSGWIIFIDDDAVLIDKYFISNLSKICKRSTSKDIIIFDAYIGEKKQKFPIDFDKQLKHNNIIKGHIDMACFAVHKTCSIPFTKQCAGDYNFIKYAHDSGYNLKYVDIAVGIWGNYLGWQNGKHMICTLDI